MIETEEFLNLPKFVPRPARTGCICTNNGRPGINGDIYITPQCCIHYRWEYFEPVKKPSVIYPLTDLPIDTDKRKKTNKIVSEETRAKISASHKGKVVSEETKAKIRATMIAKIHKPHSLETRAKMSAAHYGMKKIRTV